MNEEEKKPTFFDENDLKEIEKRDALGFNRIADEKIIPDIESFETPLIYGIYGEWGSGKTFMMKVLEKCFEEKGRYKTVWFDPWLYEHADKEQLFLGLLRKIETKIETPKKILTGIGLRFGAGAKTAFQVAADILFARVGTSWWSAKKAYKESLKELSSNRVDQVDEVEKAHQELGGVIADALDQKQATKLVLFIDDLDRCLPEKAILLLDQLKNFLDLPKVITILGIDDKVFAAMLQKHYGYANDKDSASTQDKTLKDFGKRYLEKIIQKSYRIIGARIVKNILMPYIPYSKCISVNPDPILDVMSTLWMKLSDFNARRIHRAARDVISISNMTTFQSIVKDILKENPVDQTPFSLFCEENFILKYTVPVTNETHKVIVISVCLWILLALRATHGLPLVENVPQAIRNLFTQGTTSRTYPPLKVLQKIYEKFQQWLG